MGVVEIVNISLKPTSNVTDASSPAGEALAKALKIASSQPGYNKLFWGVEVDNASALHIAVGEFIIQTPLTISSTY